MARPRSLPSHLCMIKPSVHILRSRNWYGEKEIYRKTGKLCNNLEKYMFTHVIEHLVYRGDTYPV
jgi:hypothetical protein